MSRKFTPHVLTLLVLLAFACDLLIPSAPTLSPAAQKTDTTPASGVSSTPLPSATIGLSSTPLPSATSALSPTPLPSATSALSPTPAEPVFNPGALGDNRVLDSFILTRKDKKTGGGEVDDHEDTIGYIKEPFNAYKLEDFSLGGAAPVSGQAKTYLIGGWVYKKTGLGDWFLLLGTLWPDDLERLHRAADMRGGYAESSVISAQFVGREDFQGIPANHFTFDQTDLRESETSGTVTGGYKVEQAQGDLYLAQDGNYPLHFHVKLTGNVYSPAGSADYIPGVHEITEDLSSINQVKEFAVPADFLALKLELDLGLPLPADATLVALYRYASGLSVDYYEYSTASLNNNDELLAFYKNLAPTDGWTVSYVGEVKYHPLCLYQDCVILKKGDAQFILYHDEQYRNPFLIFVDFDRQHVFHPK